MIIPIEYCREIDQVHSSLETIETRIRELSDLRKIYESKALDMKASAKPATPTQLSMSKLDSNANSDLQDIEK